MLFKTSRLTALILTIPLLLEIGSIALVQAQGRTSGNSRNPENGSPAPSPVAVSEGSRDIGRTREPDRTPPGPTPSESRDQGRSSSGRLPPTSPTAEIPQPPPPSGTPHHPPVHDCPEIVGRPIGGIIIGEIEPREGSGFWLRNDIRYGKDVTLAESSVMPEYSGYDFSELLKRPFDDPFTDMFVEDDGKGLVMSVREDTEIMDVWPTFVPENAIFVPRHKWSSTHQLPLILGHEYIVRTWDHHYAKFVVTSLTENRVVFDWAYQYGTDNELEVTALVHRDAPGSKFRR